MRALTSSNHVAVANGLHLVHSVLVHQAVKGIVQVGEHEEDLHCGHGGRHGAETHDVTEHDDHMVVCISDHMLPLLRDQMLNESVSCTVNVNACRYARAAKDKRLSTWCGRHHRYD